MKREKLIQVFTVLAEFMYGIRTASYTRQHIQFDRITASNITTLLILLTLYLYLYVLIEKTLDKRNKTPNKSLTFV